VTWIGQRGDRNFIEAIVPTPTLESDVLAVRRPAHVPIEVAVSCCGVTLQQRTAGGLFDVPQVQVATPAVGKSIRIG
jgi:hypothetical protein